MADGLVSLSRSISLSKLLTAAAVALGCVSAQAALLLRDINGNPVVNAADATFVYDDHQNLTWLRDWNYAETSGFDADGRMAWGTAMNWAANLTVGTFSGWRLPTTNTGPSSNCSGNFDPGGGFPLQYYRFNCTGSEMGHIWYTELGNTAGSLSNNGPFSNMQSGLSAYWSGTEDVVESTFAWHFLTGSGYQGPTGKDAESYAVAVRPGDVAAVPEPTTLALLGLGLAGLAATRRRK